MGRHLQVLEQEGILDLWDDRRIAAGDNWRVEIEEAIHRAQVAVLLVSAEYLASRFVREEELRRILELRRRGGLRVIPVIIKPCAWQRVEWLEAIQVFPDGGRAISSGKESEIEEDLAELAKTVADLVSDAREAVDVRSDEVSAMAQRDGRRRISLLLMTGLRVVLASMLLLLLSLLLAFMEFVDFVTFYFVLAPYLLVEAFLLVRSLLRRAERPLGGTGS